MVVGQALEEFGVHASVNNRPKQVQGLLNTSILTTFMNSTNKQPAGYL